MTKDDRHRADARFNKADPGKLERDAALKAVTDNMAKLKALRLAREAAAPPRPAAAAKTTRAKSKTPGEKTLPWRIGWRASKTAAAGLKARYAGAGHSIIDRVLVAASYTCT
jgi:hypothetical protein